MIYSICLFWQAFKIIELTRWLARKVNTIALFGERTTAVFVGIGSYAFNPLKERRVTPN